MREASNQDKPRAPVFRRELPGGGYVVIGVERPTSDRSVPRTCVWVERRTGNERDADHEPPIIASVEGDERSAAFTDMYRLAADNAAVARGLMEWKARRQESPRRAD